jgi:hypothetical protein
MCEKEQLDGLIQGKSKGLVAKLLLRLSGDISSESMKTEGK